jgi:hypothetical protein
MKTPRTHRRARGEDSHGEHVHHEGTHMKQKREREDRLTLGRDTRGQIGRKIWRNTRTRNAVVTCRQGRICITHRDTLCQKEKENTYWTRERERKQIQREKNEKKDKRDHHTTQYITEENSLVHVNQPLPVSPVQPSSVTPDPWCSLHDCRAS